MTLKPAAAVEVGDVIRVFEEHEVAVSLKYEHHHHGERFSHVHLEFDSPVPVDMFHSTIWPSQIIREPYDMVEVTSEV